MIITSLHLQNGTLLIAALINIVMSVIVFSRGVKNKINLYFGLLTFFNFLWVIGMLIGRVLTLGMFWYYAGALLIYPIALGIAIFLYYFCISFPMQIKRLSNLNNLLVILPAIVMSIIVYMKGWFILSYYKDIVHTEYTLYVNKLPYSIYSLYFIVLVILALKELHKKIKVLDSVFRKQIIMLFIAILIGLIFGVYFDLVLFYFGNYHYIWLGPIFTAFMNAYVFYLITSSKEKINNG